jgi:hypothetical protein
MREVDEFGWNESSLQHRIQIMLKHNKKPTSNITNNKNIRFPVPCTLDKRTVQLIDAISNEEKHAKMKSLPPLNSTETQNSSKIKNWNSTPKTVIDNEKNQHQKSQDQLGDENGNESISSEGFATSKPVNVKPFSALKSSSTSKTANPTQTKPIPTPSQQYQMFTESLNQSKLQISVPQSIIDKVVDLKTNISTETISAFEPAVEEDESELLLPPITLPSSKNANVSIEKYLTKKIRNEFIKKIEDDDPVIITAENPNPSVMVKQTGQRQTQTTNINSNKSEPSKEAPRQIKPKIKHKVIATRE